MKCTIDQLLLIDAYAHPQLPKDPVDFTRLFPRYLCLKIFSFLDPRSLCRATQVSFTIYKLYFRITAGMLVLALFD